jgi:hypothetical protein
VSSQYGREGGGEARPAAACPRRQRAPGPSRGARCRSSERGPRWPCVKWLTAHARAGKLPKHSLAAQAAANLERFKGPPPAQPEVATLLHPP